MTQIADMTELDAVNTMLIAIGQAPVSALNNSIGDVAQARTVLAQLVRSVQLYGFAFNTDSNRPLNPDIDGVIVLPQGYLRVDATNRAQNVVERRHPTKGMALWDSTNFTWEFPGPVNCDVVLGFPFEDMPAAARHYITVAATRRFQSRIIGSPQLDRFNAEDEASAWDTLLRADRAAADINVFNNPVIRGFGRRSH